MAKTLLNLGRAAVVVGALAFAPTAASAQSLTSTDTGFEPYRAMAVTAGVIGGAVVATVLTDGLILPVLAGGRVGLNGMAEQFVSTAGTVFGAVAGGLYGNEWYSKQ